jgi:hypothetical protein
MGRYTQIRAGWLMSEAGEGPNIFGTKGERQDRWERNCSFGSGRELDLETTFHEKAHFVKG